MADLQAAFGTFFDEIDCRLEFDVVPLYKHANGTDNKQYMGMVTINSNQPITSFNYRVFNGTQPQDPFTGASVAGVYNFSLGGDIRPPPGFGGTGGGNNAIIEGTINSTNNKSFTFPIESLQQDYFVLISPVEVASIPLTNIPVSGRPNNDVSLDNAPAGLFVRAATTSKPSMKQTFAIFYPKRILKERKRRMQNRPDSFKSGPPDYFSAVQVKLPATPATPATKERRNPETREWESVAPQEFVFDNMLD